MKSTSLALPEIPPSPLLAPAHANGKTVPHWTMLAFAPAGAVRSTASDMALFMGATLGFPDSPIGGAIAETLSSLILLVDAISKYECTHVHEDTTASACRE